MKQHYFLYVDESGQSGIRKIRDGNEGGASPFMTMGAALVPAIRIHRIREALADITATSGKRDLHCSKLNHSQIVFYSREIAKQKFLAFGVISKKSTLGSYKDEIKSNHQLYYNKCAQYLLEKVGLFMKFNKLHEDQLTIIFEKGNYNYSALRSLISKCRANPIHDSTQLLKYTNPQSILCKEKGDEPLLQLGDLIAHALFKCVDKTDLNYHTPEPRYLRELRSRFFSDRKTSKVEGFGIKSVHSLSNLSLDYDIAEIIKNLKAS